MRTISSTPAAVLAIDLVESLQRRLVGRLVAINDDAPFTPVEWLRDGGVHGGGLRLEAADTGAFNRASVNVSHVHYDDIDTKPLRSATALSSIIHLAHPRAPSLHVHISWTELRAGTGTWRIMADLNPSTENVADTARFKEAVTRAFQDAVGPDVAKDAIAQGDRYFFIPALKRHRGVFHTYLESYATNDHTADLAAARHIGEVVIDTYAAIVKDALAGAAPATDEAKAAQLAYHTAYLFQVLTLDRGTTSGLLVHDQNDVGILGSLPSRVDRALLSSWATLVPAAQKPLVEAIVDALPDAQPCPVGTDSRKALAGVVRTFYRAHPDALELQARGDIIPPTVANHAP